MSDIAGAIERASAYLTDHPDDARYRDSAATARLGAGLRVDVSGPGGETLQADMPTGIGGGASAPSPGWYFRAAAASCVAALIGIRAAAVGLALPPGSVEVTVDSESDDRGILGLDADIPAGVLSLRIVAAMTNASAERAAFEDVARWAVEHCPVTDTAARAVPIELEFR